MVTIELPQLPEQATLHIYNSLGALVKTLPVQNSRTQLDLSDLPDGIYGWSLQGATGKGMLLLRR